MDVVAVTDGIVTAVGGPELLDLRGTRTDVIDIGAGALLPGFVDAHIHAVAGGLAQLGCDLSTVHSLAEYRRIIAEYAARVGGPWIEGSGWYGDVFPRRVPDEGGARPARARPPGRVHEPRPAQRVGQLAGAGGRRYRRRETVGAVIGDADGVVREAIGAESNAARQLVVAVAHGVPEAFDDTTMRVIYEMHVASARDDQHARLLTTLWEREVSLYESILARGQQSGEFELRSSPHAIAETVVALEDGFDLHLTGRNASLDRSTAMRRMLDYLSLATRCALTPSDPSPAPRTSRSTT